MKRFKFLFLTVSVVLLSLAGSSVFADITITPRVQAMLFTPDSDADEDQVDILPTPGMSVEYRSEAESDWSIRFTGFYGKTSGDIDDDFVIGIGGFPAEYDNDRLDLEFLTLFRRQDLANEYRWYKEWMLGIRYIETNFDEFLLTNGNALAYTEDQKMFFGEGGLKISVPVFSRSVKEAKIDGDKHFVYTEAMLGLGVQYLEGFDSDFVVADDPFDETNFLASLEFAIGYTYRVTDHSSIGLRYRAFISTVADSGAVYGPELNCVIKLPF